MTDRKPISKSLRFAVFARDAFTCRYCGVQPGDVRLVVDHLIPVAQGGTNDESNLITACEPCNQGKSARRLDQAAPTEMDRLRMVQESLEQRHAAEHAADFIAAKKDLEQEMINLWCEIRGHGEAEIRTVRIVSRYVQEVGLKTVAEWIQRAHDWKPHLPDYKIGQIVSGYRRAERERAEQLSEVVALEEEVRRLREQNGTWRDVAEAVLEETYHRLQAIVGCHYRMKFPAAVDALCVRIECNETSLCIECRSRILWGILADAFEVACAAEKRAATQQEVDPHA